MTFIDVESVEKILSDYGFQKWEIENITITNTIDDTVDCDISVLFNCNLHDREKFNDALEIAIIRISYLFKITCSAHYNSNGIKYHMLKEVN